MAFLLLIVGGLIVLVGGLWMLVLAFKESVLWGLGSMFVPFVSLVFLIMFWQTAKKPFFIQLGGAALIILGAIIAPTPQATVHPL